MKIIFKRSLSLLLCVLLCMSAVPGAALADAFNHWDDLGVSEEETAEMNSLSDNEYTIFQFAVNSLGVNTAAAAGIVANIKAESSFDPHNSYTESDGSLSYGICQWNKGRLTALQDYCSEHGYDYTTLDGQLQYLKHELNGTESSAFNKVKNVSNSAQGAYDAGYNWARYFERCASRYYEERAVSARDTYWPKYGNTGSTTTTSTGNTQFQSAIVDIAASTQGWDYSAFGGESGVSWCGYYVRYVLENAYSRCGCSIYDFIDYSVLTGATRTAHYWRINHPSEFYSWTKWSYSVNGTWADVTDNISSYYPRIGDIILVETGGGLADGPDHIGIIVQVNSDGSFRTSEGNTNPGTNDTRVVKYHDYKYFSSTGKYGRSSSSSNYVHAICRPTDPASSLPAPTYATLTADRTVANLGEKINFTLSSDYATNYYMSVWKAGVLVKEWSTEVSAGTSAKPFIIYNESGHLATHMSAFNSNGSVDSNWIDFYYLADHGADFFAYIMRQDTRKHLERTPDGNVQIASDGNDSKDPRQLWHFVQNSDKSYTITSCYDDMALEAAGTTPDSNVCVGVPNGSNSQKWYIYSANGASCIKSAYGDLVLDCVSLSSEPGTNVIVWSPHEGANQIFSIYNIDNDGWTYNKPAKPAKVTLTAPATFVTNDRFPISWTASPLVGDLDSRSYTVRAYDEQGRLLVETTGIQETETTVKTSATPMTVYLEVAAVNDKYANWETKSNRVKVVINEEIPVTGIALNKTSLSLAVGKSETLIATISPADATNKNVTWSSSNPSVATVDADGKVTPKQGGTTTITVKTEDGGKTASCTVKINPVLDVNGYCDGTEYNNLSGIGTFDVYLNGILVSDDTYDYWSSQPRYVTYEIKDIRPAPGYVYVGVKLGNLSGTFNTENMKVVLEFAKEKTVTGVSLNKSSLTLNVGGSETLTATVSPSDASNKNVTWSSSDTNVATVDANGKVTAKKPGTATITVKTEDGGKTAKCTVTVKQPVTGVSLSKSSLTLNVGGSETLTATVSPSDASNKNVTWSSSDTTVATVDASGKVTAKKPGTATITVKTEDGGKTAACTVKVEPEQTAGILSLSTVTARPGEEVTLDVSIAENPGVMSMVLGLSYDKTYLTLTGYEDGGLTGWTVADKAVWIGNEDSSYNGVILRLKFKVADNAPEGELPVTLSCRDGDAYNHAEQALRLAVQSGGIKVSKRVPGDVTGDGKVNALDLLRLRKHLAGETVELVGSGDVTGDGKVNALDLLRLKKHLAGETVVLNGTVSQVMCAAAVMPDADSMNTSADRATLTVATVEGEPGETVTVPVTISNNPGIMVLNPKLSFDSSALDFVCFEDSGFTGWTVTESAAVWLGDEDSSYNGEILRLIFRVKDEAPAGSYEVRLICEDGDAFNHNEDPIAIETVSGGVNLVWILPPVLTKIEAKAPTCTEAGNIEYWVGDNGKYYADAEGTREITAEDTVVPAAGHSPAEAAKENEVAATCTEAGSYDEVICCTVCMAELSRETKAIDALGHDWGEWSVTTAATCTEKGVETRICKHDAAHKETRDIPAAGHSLSHVEAKAPTAAEAGNIEYWVCERCGKLFGDEHGAFELSPEDVILPAISLDLNGDGKEDAADAEALFRYIAGDEAAIVGPAPDLNRDGQIGNRDAILFFRRLAGAEA